MQVIGEPVKAYTNPFIFRAESFLSRCKNMTIGEQLKDRQIEEVHGIRFRATGLVIYGPRSFYVNINLEKPLAEQIEVIGVAVCETFLYNFTSPLPGQKLNPEWMETARAYSGEFSRHWIEVNGFPKIVNWLQYNIH